MRAHVGEVQITVAVDGELERAPERRLRGESTIGGRTDLAVAGHCGDDPIQADLADPVVAGVNEEEVTGGVHCNTNRVRQSRRDCRASVPEMKRFP